MYDLFFFTRLAAAADTGGFAFVKHETAEDADLDGLLKNDGFIDVGAKLMDADFNPPAETKTVILFVGRPESKSQRRGFIFTNEAYETVSSEVVFNLEGSILKCGEPVEKYVKTVPIYYEIVPAVAPVGGGSKRRRNTLKRKQRK